MADLAFDDVREANIAFGLHGLACAALALWLIRSARAQEQIVREACGGLTASAPPAGPDEDPSGGWNPLQMVASVVLVLGGIGMLGWYVSQVHVEQTHLGRAV
jgi:hypothetical protein